MGIFKAFKTQKLVVDFYFNKLVIKNLLTNKTLSKNATKPFSHQRTILANYLHLEELLKSMLKELTLDSPFGKLKLIAKLGEPIEGGITEIEKRAICDSLQHSGARFVYFSEKTVPLSTREALKIIEDETKLMF